jgi:DNA recombination protein RmuC
MLEILFGILALFILAAFVWQGLKLNSLTRLQSELPLQIAQTLDDKHREMLTTLHEGLAAQGERMAAAVGESSERLRAAVSQELKQTRDAMLALQLSQSESLSQSRESMIRQLSDLAASLQAKQDVLRTELLTNTLQTLAEQGRAGQELLQTSMGNATQQLTTSIEALTKTVDGRLEQISGKVTERLDEGFKKTNETFANVMARLATIDEAQKKIDGLTTNVVSLQELLGDKRARGAFGEVQMESLVRNILPPTTYAMQYTLSNGNRVDCALFLPEPTGTVAMDSKFPLENYHRMFAPDANEFERAQAQRQFKADVKKHVDDIAAKYIVANETSDGAVMFVPAEAVFAEIHGHNPDLVEYAMQRRVWIVSPTTMMAILNTARAVIKDVETRKQVHIIKDALNKLGKEFARFDGRMKKLADHIRLAHQDAEDVAVTSQKITRRFAQIEAVELEHPEQAAIEIADLETGEQ